MRSRRPSTALLSPGPSRRRLLAAVLAAVTVAGTGAACGASAEETAASASSAASVASASSASVASESADSVASVSSISAASVASVASVSAASVASAASASASAASVAASSAASAAASSTGVTTGVPLAVRQSVADAAVAAASAAASQTTPVDLDAPGDDSGTVCAVDPRYTDETTGGLRTDVAAAWTAARALAAVDGIEMCLADGKRSRSQQQATYDDYVQKYGAGMAAQYVLPPEKSAHVRGLAIDVQPYAAYTWLEATNGRLGFCRIYDNEAWHFEYDAGYATAGCPARLAHPGT